VRHQDDTTGLIWGAPGFQAREVAASGPTVRSDLYSVGRTMAMLSLGVTGMSTVYADRLPEASAAPLLAEEESYHRLLRRATAPDPAARFGTAAQLREQVTGVLHEVLAATDGRPRTAQSTLFGPQPRSFGTEDTDDPAATLYPVTVATSLSVPLVDVSDPAASVLGTLGYPDPDEVIAALDASGQSTVEVRLRRVRAHIDNGNAAEARAELDRLAPDHPRDWRVAWYEGVANLAEHRPDVAHGAFDRVYAMLPGELDAKIAYAVSAELAGNSTLAAAHYERVWLTNRDFVSAAFGCARIRLASGDWEGAVTVLESVPQASSHYLSAQVGALRARLRRPDAAGITEPELVEASSRITRLPLDTERRALARIEVLAGALHWVEVHGEAPDTKVLDHRLVERELRFGLEKEYRNLARFSSAKGTERVRLVAEANALRPWTLV
jgi:serine/threonine-protein kinase PknG